MFHEKAPRICDYEGSDYRSEFWEQADRRYEDAAERLALRSLLPPTGGRLVEIGAGFGRLIDEYAGYDEVILLDYARSMLEDAHASLGDRFTYVCADLYHLPFMSSALDTVVQVRVLHHVEDVPAAFAEVARVLAAGGSYVLEFANKRNLKAVGRHALGRPAGDPFDDSPYEFVPLNWNFQPRAVERQLADAGLAVRSRRALSLFRAPALKACVAPERLAALDHAVGGLLGGLAPAPSQLVRALQPTGGAPSRHLWRCPACGQEPLVPAEDEMPCPGCGTIWRRTGGVWGLRPGA
jgi:SAM-dependent methyltransferase